VRYARQPVLAALAAAGLHPAAGSNQVRIPIPAGRDGVQMALEALRALGNAPGPWRAAEPHPARSD
jgi:hypothetical protein